MKNAEKTNMHRASLQLMTSLILVTATSGCMMLGPDYQSPSLEQQVASQWQEYEDPNLNVGSPVLVEWWRHSLRDKTLDRLISFALADNLTLRSAALRVMQSQQQLAIAVGEQFPQQQSLGGSTTRQRTNKENFSVYDLGFDVSWEADIWGRFSRQVESASAQLDASIASYDGVLVSLVAQVAQAYLSYRTTEQRLIVAKNNVKIQEQSVDITQAKFASGATSALDVEQAQTLLFNTRASVYSLEITAAQLRNSLAVLLGRPPGDLDAVLGSGVIPRVGPELVVGMPQDIIRQRPDLRVAERQLAAQSAQIGYAITELYPHFSIGGSIGTGISTAGEDGWSDLFTNEAFNYNYGVSFRWNIFNYGRLRSNVRLQDARFQQLLEDYRQRVLSAQAEVENNIAAYLIAYRQLKDIRDAAESAQRAVEIAELQYKDGLVSFDNVLSTLSSLLAQQDKLAAAEGSLASDLVNIYTSVGGGWQLRATSTPDDMLSDPVKREMLERTDHWQGVFEN